MAAQRDLRISDDLRERWAAGASLRDLGTYCNERVLGAALRSVDAEVIEGEAANLYRLLTDESVSAGQRVTRRHGSTGTASIPTPSPTTS